jgi:hypothetical protein
LNIAKKLGLETETFSRMCVQTKMLLSNILGHAAEVHYENYLRSISKTFTKAPTDEHFDYIVDGNRDQVKRFETSGTNAKRVGINLTQTHGDRSAQDAFYEINSFDRLVAFDVGFENHATFRIKDIPRHSKYPNHLCASFKFDRENYALNEFQSKFLNAMKVKNEEFPNAINSLINQNSWTYSVALEKFCGLDLGSIDELFSEENFRLITGAKGFAAEEHFNVLLEKEGISYRQDKNMYSKVDHWLGNKRIQVKIPNQRAVTDTQWAFKTHKSHGSGVGELYKVDSFDFVALFIGYEIDESKDKYLPVRVSNSFIIVPIEDIEQHPNHPGYLKRVTTFPKDKYKVNDLSLLTRN